MLRILVLTLLLANGLYYAWSHGLLADYGFGPAVVTEPQRLEQQIRPQALRVLSGTQVRAAEGLATSASAADAAGVAGPASSASTLAASAAAPGATGPSGLACLQAGVFDETQATGLRRALEPLPAGSWTLEPVTVPGRWIVYMGRYPNAEAVDKKKAELRALRIRFEALSNAQLEPGLSLGGFSSADAANEELANLARRGVRTARVTQERAELRGSRLRLPAVDDALKLRMQDFNAALAGKPLKPCE